MVSNSAREKRQASKESKEAKKALTVKKPLTTEERKEKRNRLSAVYADKEKKELARQEKYKKLANDILNKYKITTPATLKETDPTAFSKYQQHKRTISGSQSKIKKYQKYQEKIVQDDLDDFLDDEEMEVTEDDKQGPSTLPNKENDANWNEEDDDDEDKLDENKDDVTDAEKKNEESETEFHSDMNDNNNDNEEGEVNDSDEDSNHSENPNNIPIAPKNTEDSVVTNSFISSFDAVTGQVRDNMMDGDPEGPHKYMSKIQFFKQELNNCNGKMTLSFKNRKIRNSSKNKTKEYADPLEAINDGVEPCEILNSFLNFIDVPKIYDDLKSADKTPESLSIVFRSV